MPRYLWFRITVVAVVIVVAGWYVYPPKQRINLGLDLQGGIHLVLGVDVDKAIENVAERTAADVRAALERKGIGAQVTRRTITGIQVQLTSPATFASSCRGPSPASRESASSSVSAPSTSRCATASRRRQRCRR